jgi:ABC-type Fe2+-enterobactin transport system substrate-binding protein
MAHHISLKFQNNTASMPFKLYTVGLKLTRLPERNIADVNYHGNHMSLKLQNNTASTGFQLQMLGLGIAKLPEQ